MLSQSWAGTRDDFHGGGKDVMVEIGHPKAWGAPPATGLVK